MILMKITIFMHDRSFFIIARCKQFGAGVAVFATPGV
jgi:hypothetical protein